MIIPCANPWRERMCSLQGRVAPVLRVAHAVVGERDHLRDRIMNAANLGRHFSSVTIHAIFVQIVTKMKNDVEVFFLRQRFIGVEISKLPV